MHQLSRTGVTAFLALALAAGILGGCSSNNEAEGNSGADGISVHDATIPVPASDVAAVYLTIENAGPEADRLTGASSSVAGQAGIHQTSVTDGTAAMAAVDVVEIPADSAVVFAPGGFHVMLMDLRDSLEEGDEVQITLTFEREGDLEVVATVVASGASSDAGHGDDSGGAMAETVQGAAFAEYYQSNCAVCHGAQRQGVVGPALTSTTLTQDDAVYIDTVMNGRPGTAMPAWASSGLTASEAAGLVHWLKTEAAP